MLTILGSMVNTDGYMTILMSTRTFNLIMSKINYMSSKNSEANGYRQRSGFANHLTLSACFISYKKWVQREKSPKDLSSLTEERL